MSYAPVNFKATKTVAASPGAAAIKQQNLTFDHKINNFPVVRRPGLVSVRMHVCVFVSVAKNGQKTNSSQHEIIKFSNVLRNLCRVRDFVASYCLRVARYMWPLKLRAYLISCLDCKT